MQKDKMGKVRKGFSLYNFLCWLLKFSCSQAHGNCSFLIFHALRFVHRAKTSLADSVKVMKEKASRMQLPAQDHCLTGVMSLLTEFKIPHRKGDKKRIPKGRLPLFPLKIPPLIQESSETGI